MHFTGSNEVLANLFKKRELLRTSHPDTQKIRPLLLALSGTMRGVYGGGQVTALERFGLTEVFDYVVGISTGAPALAYFLAGQAALGTTIYCEECASSKFMSSLHALKGRSIIDLDYLASVFRGIAAPKRLDLARLGASRSQFLVGVTKAASAEGILLEAKQTMPDAVQALRASIAIPGASKPVRIDDTEYYDGGVAFPFPLRPLISRYRPTDILVLANRNEVRPEPGPMRRFLDPILFRNLSAGMRERIGEVETRFQSEREFAAVGSGVCRVGILWSDHDVGSFTADQVVLRRAAERAEIHLSDLLARATRA